MAHQAHRRKGGAGYRDRTWHVQLGSDCLGRSGLFFLRAFHVGYHARSRPRVPQKYDILFFLNVDFFVTDATQFNLGHNLNLPHYSFDGSDPSVVERRGGRSIVPVQLNLSVQE